MTRLPRAGQGGARRRQLGIEELSLVDADDFGVGIDPGQQLGRVFDVLRGDAHVAVRHDVIFAEAVVHQRLEGLHLLAGNLRAPQAADQLFALAAEHAAGDDFNPAVLRFSDNVHRNAEETQTPAGTSHRTLEHHARDWYSPVSVLTRTLSPSLTNGGT